MGRAEVSAATLAKAQISVTAALRVITVVVLAPIVDKAGTTPSVPCEILRPIS